MWVPNAASATLQTLVSFYSFLIVLTVLEVHRGCVCAHTVMGEQNNSPQINLVYNPGQIRGTPASPLPNPRLNPHKKSCWFYLLPLL